MAKLPTKEELSTEDHLDCRGNKRTFRLSEYANRRFLEAVEQRKGEDYGLRFVMPIWPGQVTPWGEMREKIRERLSQRDLVRDRDGTLHDLHKVIRAQIAGRSEEETPILVVDDLEISWEELGHLLMTYEGWGLRIQICECGEE